MYNKPIFFQRNRVRRVYQGGLLLSKLYQEEGGDGYEPEEWIASAVKAQNMDSENCQEGLSRTEEGELFIELLEKHPEELLGDGMLRVLVKILDSAVRLPAQAHPDKSFSKRYWGVGKGKTESWVVLETRPGACVYFGFQEGVRREDFLCAIRQSEEDCQAMERLMNRIPVKKGDVFFVPPKTIHAIGAGCLILEVQEPTDFTIQPERWCASYRLSDQEMYIGLGKEEALSCFLFGQTKDPRVIPTLLDESDRVKIYSVIGKNHTDCFCVERLEIYNGVYRGLSAPGVYFVAEGALCLWGSRYKRNLKPGDYFFLPHAARGLYSFEGVGNVFRAY